MKRRHWICLSLTLVTLSLAQIGIAQVLRYGDGASSGKRSIGGGGHLIMFEAPKDGMWLNAVEVFGSRYGVTQPPDEDFDLFIVDADRRVLRQIALPYLLWERGDLYWRSLPLPPLKVSQKFGIGLGFRAQQTKGVYVGTTTAPVSHSFTWLPGDEGKPLEGEDWMVRVTVGDTPEGDPAARDLIIDRSGEAFFDRLANASGAPVTLELATRGKASQSTVRSIRFGTVSSPAENEAIVLLLSGVKLRGQIVKANEQAVTLLVNGAERSVNRSDIARIDLPLPD